MNVFAYNTYKEFLRAYIDQHESRGIISQLATICGCDRTYISQVLNGKAELTPDHMIQFLEHLDLGATETNYILFLLLRDRSGSAKARRAMGAKVKQLRDEALTVSNKVYRREKPKEITDESRTQYYSSWIYGAVHILTSIEKYQTASAIAEKLQVPMAVAVQTLNELVDMKVIKLEKGRYVHAGADVYLPRHYPQSSAHHLSWRMKAVERSFIKDDVHYTLAFSVSGDDVEKVRLQILQLIEDQRKLVHSSGTDVACAFCVDFFVL